MAGRTSIPFSSRCRSARGVVGAFAALDQHFALNLLRLLEIDHLLERGWDEEVDGGAVKVRLRDGLNTRGT